jgi:hypothetical protein
MAWYEVDANWYGICALRPLGLAWDVKVQKLNRGESKDAGKADCKNPIARKTRVVGKPEGVATCHPKQERARSAPPVLTEIG